MSLKSHTHSYIRTHTYTHARTHTYTRDYKRVASPTASTAAVQGGGALCKRGCREQQDAGRCREDCRLCVRAQPRRRRLPLHRQGAGPPLSCLSQLLCGFCVSDLCVPLCTDCLCLCLSLSGSSLSLSLSLSPSLSPSLYVSLALVYHCHCLRLRLRLCLPGSPIQASQPKPSQATPHPHSQLDRRLAVQGHVHRRSWRVCARHLWHRPGRDPRPRGGPSFLPSNGLRIDSRDGRSPAPFA